MFQDEYPVFIRKHLLKIEMLENLRDYPRDFVQIFYKNYSDGILSGCEIKVCGHYLFVQPGIIVYSHRLYLLKEEVKIPYGAEDMQVYLKIKLLDEHKNIEKISYLSQIILEEAVPNQKDEIELCRFRLQKGSRLRENYVDFEDYTTTYDTLIRIYVPYSDEEGGTIAPDILRQFAKEAMECRIHDPLDLSFCMAVLQNQKVISRQMVTSYLNSKFRSEKNQYSNIEMYNELLKILEEMKHGKSMGTSSREQRKKIMLV